MEDTVSLPRLWSRPRRAQQNWDSETEGLIAASRGKLCDLVSRDWVSEFLCIHVITRKLYIPSMFSGMDLDKAIPTTQVHAISWMTRINTSHKKSVVKMHIFYDYFEMGVSLCCPGWLQMDSFAI